jgi:hypothetical protein
MGPPLIRHDVRVVRIASPDGAEPQSVHSGHRMNPGPGGEGYRCGLSSSRIGRGAREPSGSRRMSISSTPLGFLCSTWPGRRAAARPMTIEHALARLSSRPGLRALIKPTWLARQAARPKEARHNLYATLQSTGDNPGVDAFLDGLERALSAPVLGPYRKVAQRLMGSDSADYRSAVDEMSVATCLTDCGYKVTVSSPDILADDGSEVFRIELTAPLETAEFYALQDRLASQWKWPSHRVMLFVGSGVYRPTTKEREAIAGAIELVASRLPTERTEVYLESIVEPRFLRVAISRVGRGCYSYGRLRGLRSAPRHSGGHREEAVAAAWEGRHHASGQPGRTSRRSVFLVDANQHGLQDWCVGPSDSGRPHQRPGGPCLQRGRPWPTTCAFGLAAEHRQERGGPETARACSDVSWLAGREHRRQDA